MQLVNHTPFPAMTFEARDRDDRPWHVLVLRATMTLKPPHPRLAQAQRPLVLADTHHGAPGESSTREESDLAPFKPATDVLVHGTARAPGGVAAPAWETSVTVDDRQSRVRVTGPRAWLREDGRWRLTEPEPAVAVPLRYELAYGGTAREGDRVERTGRIEDINPAYERIFGIEQLIRHVHDGAGSNLKLRHGRLLSDCLGPVKPGSALSPRLGRGH